MDKDGNIDEYHSQSRYTENPSRENWIDAKVWCPFCGSKVLVRMYQDEGYLGLPTGSYECLLSHRNPNCKDLPSSYVTITFPAIPLERERFEMDSIKRRSHHKTNDQ